MAIAIPWCGQQIEVGSRYIDRDRLRFNYQVWVAVDGEAVFDKLLSRTYGKELTGWFRDRSGEDHVVHLELGYPDFWRGLLRFALFVDDEPIASGRTRLGMPAWKVILWTAGIVAAIVALLAGIRLAATAA